MIKPQTPHHCNKIIIFYNLLVLVEQITLLLNKYHLFVQHSIIKLEIVTYFIAIQMFMNQRLIA